MTPQAGLFHLPTFFSCDRVPARGAVVLWGSVDYSPRLFVYSAIIWHRVVVFWGGRSSAGRALDCGSSGRGFNPHRSPSFFNDLQQLIAC